MLKVLQINVFIVAKIINIEIFYTIINVKVAILNVGNASNYIKYLINFYFIL